MTGKTQCLWIYSVDHILVRHSRNYKEKLEDIILALKTTHLVRTICEKRHSQSRRTPQTARTKKISRCWVRKGWQDRVYFLGVKRKNTKLDY